MKSDGSVIRTDLAVAVHEDVGLPRTECRELVDDILEALIDALSIDKTVKIKAFGTFTVREKNERVGRNPKTGEEAVISARRVATFKPSNLLKRKIEQLPVN